MKNCHGNHSALFMIGVAVSRKITDAILDFLVHLGTCLCSSAGAIDCYWDREAVTYKDDHSKGCGKMFWR